MKKFLTIVATFVIVAVFTAGVVVVGFISKNPEVVRANDDKILAGIMSNFTQANYQKGTLEINVNGKKARIDISVKLKPAIKAFVSADLKEFGIAPKVNVNYNGEGVFLEFGKTKLKLKMNDVNSAQDQIKTILSGLSTEILPLFQATEGLNNKVDLSFAKNLQNIDTSQLSGLLKYIKTSKTRSGYTLNFDYNGIKAKANFDLNYSLLNFSTNTISVAGSTISAKFVADDGVPYVPYVYENTYTDASNILNLANAGVNTLSGGQVKFSGDLKLTLPVLGEKIFKVSAITKITNGVSEGAILIDNLPTGAYMNVAVSSKTIINPDLRHYVFIRFKGNNFYYERFVNTETSRKVNGQKYYGEQSQLIAKGSFNLADLQNNSKKTISLLTPVLGIGKAVTDAMNFVGINLFKLQSLSLGQMASNLSYSRGLGLDILTVDLQNLTGNKDLSTLKIGIETKNQKINSLSIAFNGGKKVSATSDITVGKSINVYSHTYKNHTQLINPDTSLTNFLSKPI